MPPLSEEEQRSYVGGTYYFSQSGAFLTQIGDGADIRICSATDFYGFTCGLSWTGSLDGYFAQQELTYRLYQSTGSPYQGATGSYNGVEVDYFSGSMPKPYTDESGNIIHPLQEKDRLLSSVSGSYNGVEYSTNSCSSYDYAGLMAANAAGVIFAPTFVVLSESISVAPEAIQEVIRNHYYV